MQRKAKGSGSPETRLLVQIPGCVLGCVQRLVAVVVRTTVTYGITYICYTVTVLKRSSRRNLVQLTTLVNSRLIPLIKHLS